MHARHTNSARCKLGYAAAIRDQRAVVEQTWLVNKPYGDGVCAVPLVGGGTPPKAVVAYLERSGG